MGVHDDGGQALGILLVTISTMFVGALLAGALPYWCKVKESSVAFLAALGGGLLIGTALAIIVPEGFHAFAQVGRAGGAASCQTLAVLPV